MRIIPISIWTIDCQCATMLLHEKLSSASCTYSCREFGEEPPMEVDSNVDEFLGSSRISGFGIFTLLWSIGIGGAMQVEIWSSGGTPLEDELPTKGISLLA